MNNKKLTVVLLIGTAFGLTCTAQAQQGFGSGEGLPRNEITHVTGDLYRFSPGLEEFIVNVNDLFPSTDVDIANLESFGVDRFDHRFQLDHIW